MKIHISFSSLFFGQGRMARTKKKVNYLNNAALLEEIDKSQKIQKKNPDWTPAQCMTPRLVNMLQKLVERYSQKSNWRGYTYIDDMRSEAVLSLLQGALKFNPQKSQNPFGYLTQIVTHSFLTTLEKEKRVRNIRDTLIEEDTNRDPSNTRQVENEEEGLKKREELFQQFTQRQDKLKVKHAIDTAIYRKKREVQNAKAKKRRARAKRKSK